MDEPSGRPSCYTPSPVNRMAALLTGETGAARAAEGVTAAGTAGTALRLGLGVGGNAAAARADPAAPALGVGATDSAFTRGPGPSVCRAHATRYGLAALPAAALGAGAGASAGAPPDVPVAREAAAPLGC